MNTLPLEIAVPRKMIEVYQGTGPTLTSMAEQRRFVRFRYLTKAILRYKQSFPSIPRSDSLRLVLVTDVSKTGIGILNSEQLFPSERVNLWTSGKGILQITVARCRKVNDRCFEIGAII
ncbi:hypothetical protein DTL42_18125 [Bremerella cremea]|uniref:PilZ domain-containing protein n=1 Tax=Bremerella cremea TaxID=1031537 RepID=A0A368KMI2_9BACT|nr:hypothetical protein DTL42_18125 [Bremerella cremea]